MALETTKSPLDGYQRLTIKIGSALLVDARTGALRQNWLKALASDISELKQQGRQIIIVSSGAVALGRRLLGLRAETLPLDQAQAAASVGQVALAQAWSDAMGAHRSPWARFCSPPALPKNAARSSMPVPP